MLKKIKISFLGITIISCICFLICIGGLILAFISNTTNFWIESLEMFPFLLFIFSLSLVCATIGEIRSSKKISSNNNKVSKELLNRKHGIKDDYFFYTMAEIVFSIPTLVYAIGTIYLK